MEFTKEEQLNPDATVAIMEGMAAELQSLNEHDRHDIVKIFKEISCEYDGSESIFLKGLPEFLGLV